jgi:Na+/proline symporter
MMNEIFEETNRFFSKKGKDISLEKDIVGIWWFAYIIINFVFNVIFRFMEGDSVDPDDQISFSITWMVYSIVMVPLALVTIRMIKNYAKAEKALYHFKEDEVKVESNVVETPQEKELESSVNKGIE